MRWSGTLTAPLPLFGSKGAWELQGAQLPGTWVSRGKERKDRGAWQPRRHRAFILSSSPTR